MNSCWLNCETTAGKSFAESLRSFAESLGVIPLTELFEETVFGGFCIGRTFAESNVESVFDEPCEDSGLLISGTLCFADECKD